MDDSQADETRQEVLLLIAESRARAIACGNLGKELLKEVINDRSRVSKDTDVHNPIVSKLCAIMEYLAKTDDCVGEDIQEHLDKGVKLLSQHNISVKENTAVDEVIVNLMTLSLGVWKEKNKQWEELRKFAATTKTNLTAATNQLKELAELQASIGDIVTNIHDLWQTGHRLQADDSRYSDFLEQAKPHIQPLGKMIGAMLRHTAHAAHKPRTVKRSPISETLKGFGADLSQKDLQYWKDLDASFGGFEVIHAYNKAIASAFRTRTCGSEIASNHSTDNTDDGDVIEVYTPQNAAESNTKLGEAGEQPMSKDGSMDQDFVSQRRKRVRLERN